MWERLTRRQVAQALFNLLRDDTRRCGVDMRILPEIAHRTMETTFATTQEERAYARKWLLTWPGRFPFVMATQQRAAGSWSNELWSVGDNPLGSGHGFTGQYLAMRRACPTHAYDSANVDWLAAVVVWTCWRHSPK